MQKRNYSLDFIKLIASILIVFHHYSQAFEVYFDDNWIHYGDGKFYFGLVVELFFIISGFLSYKYIEKIYSGSVDFNSFFLHKVKRILPMVVFSTVIYTVLLFIYHHISAPSYESFSGTGVSFTSTLIASLGLHAIGAFNCSVPNIMTWYCSALLVCYALFYFATYLSSRLRLNLYVVYALIVIFGFALLSNNIFKFLFTSYECARGYYSFFTGLILAKILDNIKVTGRLGLICTVIAIVSVLLIAYSNTLDENINIWLVFVLYPSIIIASQTDFARKIFSHPI